MYTWKVWNSRVIILTYKNIYCSITFHFIVKSNTFVHVGIQSVGMMIPFFQWADWPVVGLFLIWSSEVNLLRSRLAVQRWLNWIFDFGNFFCHWKGQSKKYKQTSSPFLADLPQINCDLVGNTEPSNFSGVVKHYIFPPQRATLMDAACLDEYYYCTVWFDMIFLAMLPTRHK